MKVAGILLLLSSFSLVVHCQFKHFPAVGGGAPRGPPRGGGGPPPPPRPPPRPARPSGSTRTALLDRDQTNEVEQFQEEPKLRVNNKSRGRQSVSRSRPAPQTVSSFPDRQESSSPSRGQSSRGSLPRRRPPLPATTSSESVQTESFPAPRVRTRPPQPQPPQPQPVQTEFFSSPEVRTRPPITASAAPTRPFVPTFSLEEEQPRGQSLDQSLGDIFSSPVTEQSRFPEPSPPAPSPQDIFVFSPTSSSRKFQDQETFQSPSLIQQDRLQGIVEQSNQQRNSFQSFPATQPVSPPRQKPFQSFQAAAPSRPSVPSRPVAPARQEPSPSRQQPSPSRQEPAPFQSFPARPAVSQPIQQSFPAQVSTQDSFPAPRQPSLPARPRQSPPSSRVPKKDFMFDSDSLFSSAVAVPENSGDGGVYFSYSATLGA